MKLTLHSWIFGLKSFFIRLTHGQDTSMEIVYRIVTKPKTTDSGYIDFDQVTKRYAMTTQNTSIANFLEHEPVRDLNYLLNKLPVKRLRGKMLDVGCGSGVYSLLTQTDKSKLFQMKYEGCEVNQQLVDLAQRLYPQFTFYRSSAQHLACPSHSYQLIFCSGTIQYTLTHWRAALTEMARASKQYIILARLPLSKYHPSFFVEQSVRSAYTHEKHLFQILNRQSFENECRANKLHIVSRETTSEIYHIPTLDESILSYQYILQKK